MMELQLGLALPTLNDASAIKGLNHEGYNPCKEPVGLALLRPDNNCFVGDDECSSRKRSFQDAFQEMRVIPKTLPLLFWDKQPNKGEEEEDDDDDDAINKVDDKEDEDIVGWPPIKFPKKKVHQRNQFSQSENRSLENGCVDCQRRLLNSNYVKVKMEGVAIARKINLSLYSSLPMIKETLFAMFGIREDKWSNYELTFQDRDGRGLIPEDLPWRSFIRSVHRLKLVKTSR